MGYNSRLSLKILEKSVKVRNLPYPFLRGQPFNPFKTEYFFTEKLVQRATKQNALIKDYTLQ